jgi:hypothetical protein
MIIYHIGFLCIDRETDPKTDFRAQRMMKDAEAGKVLLTQKRLGPGKYEYRATPTIKNDWWAENAVG